MPIYEYYCEHCQRKVSVFFRSFATIGEPTCPRCGGTRLTRKFSRIVVRRGGTDLSGVDSDADFAGADDEFGGFDDFGAMDDDSPFGLDEDADPREIARWTRQMSSELGEKLDPELDAALTDMERGADPDEVLERLESTDSAFPDDE